MKPLRDYVSWHDQYSDPTSGLSWRLGVVGGYIDAALDRHAGRLTALSLCAGDGRDLIGVLGRRPDAARVRALLVELHPVVAAKARAAVKAAGLEEQIAVRIGDASLPALYADGFPADLVLLVGIFGNISDQDLWRTINAAPALCAPGATLVWSRGRDLSDRNDQVRALFAGNCFTELAYDEHNEGSRPAVGAMRYDGPPRSLDRSETLFAFLR